MQDITKEKCDNIPVGTEGRLVDKRDNKVYWVARLKNSVDDNALCWMTQNLDYDGGAVSGYNGSDVATLVKAISITKFDNSTIGSKQYYDPGDYMYTLGFEANSCNEITINTGLKGCMEHGWRSYSSDLMKLDNIFDSTWVATSEPDFYSTANYTSADGKMICTKEINNYFGDMTSDYIPCRIYSIDYPLALHYVVGNYYNWSGATNGTVAGSDGTSVDTSICPTGWSLPLGNNVSVGSFEGLLSGFNKGIDITITPYYFVYGGYINNSTLSSAGGEGRYWSSTAASGITGYLLYFYGSSLKTSYNYNRYLGQSVRCVAR